VFMSTKYTSISNALCLAAPHQVFRRETVLRRRGSLATATDDPRCGLITYIRTSIGRGRRSWILTPPEKAGQRDARADTGHEEEEDLDRPHRVRARRPEKSGQGDHAHHQEDDALPPGALLHDHDGSFRSRGVTPASAPIPNAGRRRGR